MPRAESIRVLCACGKKLNAPAGSEGKKARCPACGSSIVIGAPAAAQPKPAAAKPIVAQQSAPAPARVAAAPVAVAPVAVAHAPAPAVEDDDPFKALCEAADEMAMAPVEEVPRCPQCHSAMGGGAVVCIKCGYDSRSGKRLTTEAEAKKPSRLTLAYGGGKKKEKVQDAMAPDGSFILGLVLSAVFAFAASLIWIGIAWATGFTIGYIALLIGAAAGLGMQAGHRGYSSLGGFAAAGITLATIFTAKYIVLLLVLNRTGLSISDLDGAKLGFYFFSPIGLIIIAVGVGAAYKTANGSSS